VVVEVDQLFIYRGNNRHADERHFEKLLQQTFGLGFVRKRKQTLQP
jgi:hypothetical protein